MQASEWGILSAFSKTQLPENDVFILSLLIGRYICMVSSLREYKKLRPSLRVSFTPPQHPHLQTTIKDFIWTRTIQDPSMCEPPVMPTRVLLVVSTNLLLGVL